MARAPIQNRWISLLNRIKATPDKRSAVEASLNALEKQFRQSQINLTDEQIVSLIPLPASYYIGIETFEHNIRKLDETFINNLANFSRESGLSFDEICSVYGNHEDFPELLQNFLEHNITSQIKKFVDHIGSQNFIFLFKNHLRGEARPINFALRDDILQNIGEVFSNQNISGEKKSLILLCIQYNNDEDILARLEFMFSGDNAVLKQIIGSEAIEQEKFALQLQFDADYSQARKRPRLDTAQPAPASAYTGFADSGQHSLFQSQQPRAVPPGRIDSQWKELFDRMSKMDEGDKDIIKEKLKNLATVYNCNLSAIQLAPLFLVGDKRRTNSILDNINRMSRDQKFRTVITWLQEKAGLQPYHISAILQNYNGYNSDAMKSVVANFGKEEFLEKIRLIVEKIGADNFVHFMFGIKSADVGDAMANLDENLLENISQAFQHLSPEQQNNILHAAKIKVKESSHYDVQMQSDILHYLFQEKNKSFLDHIVKNGVTSVIQNSIVKEIKDSRDTSQSVAFVQPQMAMPSYATPSQSVMADSIFDDPFAEFFDPKQAGLPLVQDSIFTSNIHIAGLSAADRIAINNSILIRISACIRSFQTIAEDVEKISPKRDRAWNQVEFEEIIMPPGYKMKSQKDCDKVCQHLDNINSEENLNKIRNVLLLTKLRWIDIQKIAHRSGFNFLKILNTLSSDQSIEQINKILEVMQPAQFSHFFFRAADNLSGYLAELSDDGVIARLKKVKIQNTTTDKEWNVLLDNIIVASKGNKAQEFKSIIFDPGSVRLNEIMTQNKRSSSVRYEQPTQNPLAGQFVQEPLVFPMQYNYPAAAAAVGVTDSGNFSGGDFFPASADDDIFADPTWNSSQVGNPNPFMSDLSGQDASFQQVADKFCEDLATTWPEPHFDPVMLQARALARPHVILTLNDKGGLDIEFEDEKHREKFKEFLLLEASLNFIDYEINGNKCSLPPKYIKCNVSGGVAIAISMPQFAEELGIGSEVLEDREDQILLNCDRISFKSEVFPYLIGATAVINDSRQNERARF